MNYNITYTLAFNRDELWEKQGTDLIALFRDLICHYYDTEEKRMNQMFELGLVFAEIETDKRKRKFNYSKGTLAISVHKD